MSANTYAFIALFVLSAALAIGLFLPLRDALQGLPNVLAQMLLYLGGYLVLTTIILASLKIKDDK